MSDRFDWEFDQDIQTEVEARPERSRTLRKAGWFWFVVAAVILVLASIWTISRWQLARVERNARQEAQNVLNLISQAAASNDSELFFSLQAADPAWHATLLRPDQQAFYQANPQITRAERHDNEIRANVNWTAGGREQQRLLFFQIQNNQLRQIPPSRGYWGTRQRSHHSWGDLLIYEADQEWRDDIAAYVNELVQTRCAGGGCLPTRRPFTLEIRPDYRQTAAANLLYVPSPRLIALDSDGDPEQAFWQAIDTQLRAQLHPVTIRFAVPPLLQQAVNYRSAAADFMALNAAITVEVIELELPPEEANETLAEYDGAAYLPTAAMLADGLIHDLTGLAGTAPDFDQGDFYEQIWHGVVWRERMWAMPLAGQMRLLYYDRQAHETALWPEPSLRWTWAEMERTLEALQATGDAVPPAPAASWTGAYGLMDPTSDTLYSYAYNTNLACPGQATVSCLQEIGTAEVEAALAWYGRLVSAGQMPPVAGSTLAERSHLIANWQSFQRRAAIWVDEPVRYEHHLLAGGIGVVPFPGSSRFDGITPLWVHGGFISQQSDHPRAVWEWLDFLSRRPLNATLRYVPARPSLAAETHFWEILPRPLSNAMRIAFPFARPVLISEKGLIGEEALSAVEEVEPQQ